MEMLVERIARGLFTKDPIWRFPAEETAIGLSELWDRAALVCVRLAEAGVRRDDRVVLVLENSMAYVVVLLAVWRLGAVAVPLRPYGGKYFWYYDYLTHVDRICDFRVAIYDDGNVAFEQEQIPRRIGKATIPIGELLAHSESDIVGFRPLATRRPNDVAIVQFTSGSTGQPKGVIVTHEMMMKQLEQLRANHVYARDCGRGVEVAASWLPFYHDMGMFIGVLIPLYELAEAIAVPPAYYMRNPARWFSLLSDFAVDANFTTNSMLATGIKAVKRLQPGSCDLSKLHLYIAAEKVSAKVLQRAWEVFAPLGLAPEHVHIGYGMAEYALGCTHSPKGRPKWQRFSIGDDGRAVPATEAGNAIDLVSIGIPNTDCNIVVKNAVGHELPELHVGEICVRGPCVTPGYLNDEATTRAKIIDNELHTGDLGFFYQNELYFVSRSDEMLVIGGRNLFPGDVELVVEELPYVGIGRSLLFGVESAETDSTQSVLLVEAHHALSVHDAEVRTQQIRELILDRFGFVVTTIQFVVRGTIEKTSSGKKRAKVIKERFLNRSVEVVGELTAIGVDDE